jgi:hypothetical protein
VRRQLVFLLIVETIARTSRPFSFIIRFLIGNTRGLDGENAVDGRHAVFEKFLRLLQAGLDCLSAGSVE